METALESLARSLSELEKRTRESLQDAQVDSESAAAARNGPAYASLDLKVQTRIRQSVIETTRKLDVARARYAVALDAATLARVAVIESMIEKVFR